MYIYIKIGSREFSFGNDREGPDRSRQDKPVKERQRKVSDRRRQKPPAGQDAEVEEEKEAKGD